MSIGMPGTWLAVEDLIGAMEPASADSGCGCRQPLIWDGRRGYWRHLVDGTPCVRAEPPGAERPGAERPGAERPYAERPYVERPGAERPEPCVRRDGRAGALRGRG